MAQAEESSSSNDTWFEPDDLNMATRDILQHQQAQQETNQLNNNSQSPPPYSPPPYSTQNEGKTDPNHHNNNQNDEQSKPHNYNNNQNENIDQNQSTLQSNQPNHTDTIPQAFSNNSNNTSFPHALKQAYELMQTNNNTNTNNTNHTANNNSDKPIRITMDNDGELGYDMDNLPIHISNNRETKLSLQRLSYSTPNKNITTNDNDNDTDNDNHKKESKGKYSNFFIHNFFLKKHENKEEKVTDDKEDNEEEKLNLNRIKIKGNTKEKELNDLRLTQKIESAHKGAIYCMEFSKKGDYLATGGQDSVLRIWTVCGSRADIKRWQDNDNDNNNDDGNDNENEREYNFSDIISVVSYREFTGHRSDIIDISWSNGEFILSASIDQTVMLWHTSRSRCLCLFQHSDIVTSVTFHPSEDYLFLSGSFDSRLRLWNILEHRVVDWVQVPTLVTCTTFSINGKFAIAGLYDGQCFFYHTQAHRLKYVTAIECRNSSGKYRKGRKVTGLQYIPIKSDNNYNKNDHGSPQLLISTNDSRLRMYNLSNFDMKCKYKGHENTQSQIHARFSPDGKLIICGSEDNNIYIWKVEKSANDEAGHIIFQTKKNKNRQEYYEYFKSNCKLPQVALFAPHRTIHYIHKFRTVINKNYKTMYKNNEEKIKHIILTADTEGHINIYTNHSNEKDYKYPYNHHTHHTHHSSHRKSKGIKKKHKHK